MTRTSDLVHRLARGLLYLLLFVIPFSTAAIELLFPLLFLVWLAGWGFRRSTDFSIWRSGPTQNLLLALLIYLAICTFSVSFSSFPRLSLRGLVLKTMEFILFFIIVSDISSYPGVTSRALKSLFVAAWVIGIYALIQHWAILHQRGTPIDPIRGWPLRYSRMVGPYRNPNDLATFLMVTLLLVIPQIFKKPTISSGVLWLLTFLLSGCLILSQSRGAFLGFWVGLLFLLILYTKQRRIWITAVAVFFMTAGLFLLTRSRPLQAITFTDPSSVERRFMLNTACQMIRSRPVFGVGLHTFMANYTTYSADPNQGPAYAHNCFLQIMAETGLIGLVSFLIFLVLLFFFCLRALKTSDEQLHSAKLWLSGLLAALVAFLVQSAFDTNFYALRQVTLFWVLAGLGIGLSALLLKNSSSLHGT